jgi:hypothetical protein
METTNGTRRRHGCVYYRGHRRRKPNPSPRWLPEEFWTRFGPDTAIVDTNYEPPRVATYADLGRRKRQKQDDNLRSNRRPSWCGPNRRAIYVWVFHCPGISGVYEGWWTYLLWRGGDSGKYLDRDEKIIRQLMELFPLAGTTLFGPALTHRQWQVRFARAFCCRHPDGTPRKHAGRIQGKALLWAEFHGDSFWRILGRAYLPSQSERSSILNRKSNLPQEDVCV